MNVFDEGSLRRGGRRQLAVQHHAATARGSPRPLSAELGGCNTIFNKFRIVEGKLTEINPY